MAELSPETIEAARVAAMQYETCNGPRDCSGTERGCVHCDLYGVGPAAVRAAIAQGGVSVSQDADALQTRYDALLAERMEEFGRAEGLRMRCERLERESVPRAEIDERFGTTDLDALAAYVTDLERRVAAGLSAEGEEP